MFMNRNKKRTVINNPIYMEIDEKYENDLGITLLFQYLNLMHEYVIFEKYVKITKIGVDTYEIYYKRKFILYTTFKSIRKIILIAFIFYKSFVRSNFSSKEIRCWVQMDNKRSLFYHKYDDIIRSALSYAGYEISKDFDCGKKQYRMVLNNNIKKYKFETIIMTRKFLNRKTSNVILVDYKYRKLNGMECDDNLIGLRPKFMEKGINKENKDDENSITTFMDKITEYDDFFYASEQ